jgi:hypothetical protein
VLFVFVLVLGRPHNRQFSYTPQVIDLELSSKFDRNESSRVKTVQLSTDPGGSIEFELDKGNVLRSFRQSPNRVFWEVRFE